MVSSLGVALCLGRGHLELRKDKGSCISYLLLHNKLPPLSHLKYNCVSSCSFCKSGTQEQLSRVFLAHGLQWLQWSEGWTGAGGSAPNLPHLAAGRKPQFNSLMRLSNVVLMTWQLAASWASDGRGQASTVEAECLVQLTLRSDTPPSLLLYSICHLDLWNSVGGD